MPSSEVTAKPAHLAPEFGGQFADAAIARAYCARAPYPRETPALLESLCPPGPRRVLELGCGSGDLSLLLAPHVDWLDAVDPSPPMLRLARERAGTGAANVRWIESSAEDLVGDGAYALVVAAESLHWMEWSVVLPRIRGWLAPGAVLAIAARAHEPLPWDRELRALIATHSTNRAFQPYDLVRELSQRKLFRELGRRSTAREPFEQSVDDHVESFHSRNGFSRDRMSTESAVAFDEGLRRAVLAHAPDGIVRMQSSTLVVWGEPLSG